MRILHEASIIGQAHFDALARAGIHRAMCESIAALAKNPEADQFVSTHTTKENALGLALAIDKEPHLLAARHLPSWSWHPRYRNLTTWTLRKWSKSLKRDTRIHPRRISLALMYRALGLTCQNNPTGEFDVFHSWYFPLPKMKITKHARRIITIHDVIPLIHPEWFPSGSRQFFDTIVKSISPDDWIIADSESTKRDINMMKIHNPAKIITVPLAAGNNFCPQSQALVHETRRKYGLGEREYIIALGTREPRKNLSRLIDAHECAFENDASAPDLALIGSPGWDEDTARRRSSRVRVLGRVPDQDLPAILAGAVCLAYPSLYEGFGLPPLEAMCCGTPVITSSTSSLPEVVGDAALLVDPTSIEDIAKAMRRLHQDRDLRLELRDRSIHRSKMFSWHATAKKLMDCYQYVTRNC